MSVECVYLSRACSCVRSLLSESLCRTLKKLCTSHLQTISNWTNFCSFQSNKTSSLPFQFETSRSIRNENMIKQMQSFNIHRGTLYLIASNCSPSHLISEKYKILQLIPLAQIYTSASHCKVLKTFFEAILWKLFSSFVAFLMISVASQKRRPLKSTSRWGNK